MLVSCVGELVNERDGSPPDMDSAVPPGTDAGERDAGDGDDGGVPPGIDGGPCAGGLAEDFSLTPIAGLATVDGAHAAASDDGLVIATGERGAGVQITRVDLAGATLGSAMVPGNAVWGVAFGDGATGVLVDRASDELWLVAVETDGATRFEQRLLGGISHDVTNNEWFGTGIRAGRMTWTGTEWATYHTVQRLWDDGIAHYGDTLRFHEAATGARAGTRGWGWGCSHSMEVGITQNASGTGPVCVSDCFPGKGVYFEHRTELFEDPSGNCAGRIDTRLGGIAAASDGFWIAFATPEGRASADVALMHVADGGTAGPVIWLTEDGAADADVHIAPFGDGTLVGWTSGGTDRLARVDASGAIVGAPVDIAEAALARASDFVTLPGGDVAWVTGAGSTMAIARVRSCL